MKKLCNIIFLSVFMLISCIKYATADVTVDVSKIAQKISSYATQIMETAENIQNQISVMNNIKTQGLSLDNVKNTYLGAVALGAISAIIVKSVDRTEEKQMELMSKQLELEGEATVEYYDKKIEYIKKDIVKVNTRLLELESIIPLHEEEVENKRMVYEQTPSYANKKAHEEYSKARSKLNALLQERSELEHMAVQLKEQLAKAIVDRANAQTEKNAKYKQLKDRYEALQNLEQSADTFDLTTMEFDKETEWDNIPLDDDKYVLNDQKYEDFFKLYFYDPDDVGSGDNARLEYQTQMDQITRNRKFLIINTAAHLLQVTATVRREIPIRQQAIFNYYQEAVKGEDSINQTYQYSMTRLEEAKAALLMSKVLSAKLQYLAARELTEIEPKKDWKNKGKIRSKRYTKFDLGNYLLTKDFVYKEYNRKNKKSK